MKAIKALSTLVLAGMLFLIPAQVTASEIVIYFAEKKMSFYAMPYEEIPYDLIEQTCDPGWSWEAWKWVKSENAEGYFPTLVESGVCDGEAVEPPTNPFDKFGI